MKTKIRAHYCWIIVFMALLEMLIYGGVTNNLNGLFIIPVTETLQVSRSGFSLAMTMKMVTMFGFGMVSSVLFLKFGYRNLATLGLVGGALAILLMSVSNHLFVTGLAAAILGIFECLYSTVGVSRIIGDWFHRYRGIVLGIVTAATGLGGSFFCVIQTKIIQQSGWRNAYRFSAIMLLAAAVLVFVVARNRPEQVGQRPFGEGLLPIKQRHRAGMSDDNWPGFSLKELVKRPTFYLMLVTAFVASVSMYLAFYVVVPHMQDCGLTAEEAATMQSTMLLILAVAKLLVGALSDVIGGKGVSLLCSSCAAVGLWLLTRVDSVTSGLIAVVVFSMCLPQTTITIPLLTTSLFGYRAHDTAMSIFLSMLSIGAVVASPACNLAYDLLGSYNPVFLVACGLAVTSFVLYLVLYRLAGKDKKRWYEEEAQRKVQASN